MPEGEGNPTNPGDDLAAQLAKVTSDMAKLTGELDTWKSEARKWETRAKENRDAAKQLDDVMNSKLTDQEKAIKEAVTAAQNEWRTETSKRLTLTEFKTKASIKLGADKVEKLLPAFNVSGFVDDEGNPNSKAIDDFLETLAPTPTPSNSFDFGQGPRGNGQGSAPSLAPDDKMSKDILKLAGFNFD